ncbi:hypothetical protein NDU88_002990 [Pleurodeles waltl]|uniref:Uncharacterized protein n=1 Tax=Pleurodeles waltl TaxID=8319 RepID=A0AAV7WRI2_PLEWA|nr:hypothetical protein NDU88_002990 [Pleurodeles waltl]
MAAARPKNNRSMKDMLTRPAAGKVEVDISITRRHRGEKSEEDGEAPVTGTFHECLLTSLREDLQAVKGHLLQALKEVRQELEDVGERVATLEKQKNRRDEEIEQLQQETTRATHQTPGHFGGPGEPIKAEQHLHPGSTNGGRRGGNISVRWGSLLPDTRGGLRLGRTHRQGAQGGTAKVVSRTTGGHPGLHT